MTFEDHEHDWEENCCGGYNCRICAINKSEWSEKLIG